MFNIGDVISYRAAGVCRVEDIREEALTGEKKTYYILKPLAKPTSTVFVPMDNETLCARMMALLTEAEAKKLLKKSENTVVSWVENPKERQAVFSSKITGGERDEIVAIVRALFRHKREVAEVGRKFYAGDERLLNSAVKAVVGELAYVLHCEEEEVINALCEG